MRCTFCEADHQRSELCVRLNTVAQALDLYAVPAFVTDPLNRCTWVNRPFADLVGDPIQDGLPADVRFIAAMMLGPYRHRFPEHKAEIAACLPGLLDEVASGALGAETRRLVEQTLALDADVRRLAGRNVRAWDGTIVIRRTDRRVVRVREQVVPIANLQGHANGFHISFWLPVDNRVPPAFLTPARARTSLASTLTQRQVEIARWYARGYSSRVVAEQAGITHRTARDHLEEIYSRLQIHSRAELVALLVREGLV